MPLRNSKQEISEVIFQTSARQIAYTFQVNFRVIHTYDPLAEPAVL